MASSLTVATGPLTAAFSTTDDAAAQLVLLRFAHATGANAAWTNQQKLNHVAAQLVDYMIQVAQDRYIQEESATIQAAAQSSVHW